MKKIAILLMFVMLTSIGFGQKKGKGDAGGNAPIASKESLKGMRELRKEKKVKRSTKKYNRVLAKEAVDKAKKGGGTKLHKKNERKSRKAKEKEKEKATTTES
jgi:hypothetical protein